MDEPVDHRGGDDVVSEHLAPAAEGLVAGDDPARPVRSGRRPVGRTGWRPRVRRGCSRLRRRPGLGSGPGGAARLGVGRRGGLPASRSTHSLAVANSTRCPPWQARMARPVARWVFPVPGGPRKITLSRAVTKSRVPRWAMVSRFRPRAWSKSKSSRDLRAGNRAARIRPSPPWDSRAETSRCRQAARNSSWVQDSARARSASLGTHSRIPAGCLQGTGEELQLAGGVPALPGPGAPGARAAISPPHPGRARGVVDAQRADLDLLAGDRVGDRAEQVGPAVAATAWPPRSARGR